MKRQKSIILVFILLFSFSLLGCGARKISLERVYNNVLTEVLGDEAENGSLFMSIASDNSFISVDTNPYNIEDWDNYTGVVYVKAINKELGLTEAVWEEISSVRALDGRKSLTENGIVITYSFHPDKGLNVVYKNSNE